jgi:hypothetical protein
MISKGNDFRAADRGIQRFPRRIFLSGATSGIAGFFLNKGKVPYRKAENRDKVTSWAKSESRI